MTALIIIAIAVAWLACGVVAAGFAFASWQRGEDEQVFRGIRFEPDQAGAVVVFFFWPMWLCDPGAFRKGWLWPWSAKARKEAGIES